MSSFGGFSSDRQQVGTISEINMIPLIDVMLVLLIIFMITTPLMTHSIKIDVPRVSSQAAEQDPESVDLAIKATGEMYWNDTEVTMDSLHQKMRELVVAQADKPINLRIRADGETYYEQIAQVMGAARSTGVRRLGFITTPDISASDKKAEDPAASEGSASTLKGDAATAEQGNGQKASASTTAATTATN